MHFSREPPLVVGPPLKTQTHAGKDAILLSEARGLLAGEDPWLGLTVPKPNTSRDMALASCGVSSKIWTRFGTCRLVPPLEEDTFKKKEKKNFVQNHPQSVVGQNLGGMSAHPLLRWFPIDFHSLGVFL